MRTLMLIMMIFAAGDAQAATGALKAMAEAFAGQPVALDPRISVPDCPGGIGIDWRGEARSSLIAHCVASGWRLVVPVARGTAPAAGPSPVLVRRGEPVQIVGGGAGFRVVVQGRAERDGRAGERIIVRNAQSGKAVAVLVGADGRLLLSAGPEATPQGP